MNAIEYLNQIRDGYVAWYRGVVQTKRAEGADFAVEIWWEPNVPPGKERPPHPLCADIMLKGTDNPGLALVTRETIEGSLIDTMLAGQIRVKIYEGHWESLPVWFRHEDFDFASLDPWKKKWMDVNRTDPSDPDGFTGVVHYLGRPIAEGGGHLYQIDFGTAPVEALLELIETLVSSGATEIEVGRSDGSDLPPEIQAELKAPELSMPVLVSIAMRLVSGLDEVESVEPRNNEELEVRSKKNGYRGQVYFGNLHRQLLRTGVEARAKEVYRFVRSQRELMQPRDVPELAQLRIVLKDDRFMENLRVQAAKMKPLVMERLAADIWKVCVWDAPNGMRFVIEGEPEKYGLSAAQFLERGRTNFLNARGEVEISEHGPLLVAQTSDSYDATLLVDDSWCGQMQARVKGELVACVPARHVVLLGGTETPRTFKEMRSAAARIEAGGDHLITSTILVRKGGRWEPFQAQAPRPRMPTQTALGDAGTVGKRPWWKFW